jgi:hypothetical protein
MSKSKRVRYRNTETGEAGFREGDKIVLNRPNERVEMPYSDRTWMVDKDHRPLTDFQIAHVAFQADATLCAALNQKHINDGEWLNLRDAQRIAWIKEGPKKGVRAHLDRVITEALEPLGPK